MNQAQIEFGDAILGTGLFAVEFLRRDIQTMQRGAGAGFRLAQFRQRRRGLGLTLGGFGLRFGAGGDLAQGAVLGALGFGDLDGGCGPAQVIERGFRLADLGRHGAITDRLARLLLQRFHLAGQLADDVFGAQQIGFGGLQTQFGFVAAGMQAGHAGGFFQHAAALFGFGLDDFADAALMHEGGRARAGRSVGEHDLHVTGADFTAVDAIGGAGLALDAPRDFDAVGIVEGGGRRALRIVDRDRDFGVVARRTAVVAGEDDVVHRRGAHGVVGRLAHDPAQRFDQIGFAAAIGTDNAGQAGFNQEIGRLDERLEPVEAEPRQFHCFRPRDPTAKALRATTPIGFTLNKTFVRSGTWPSNKVARQRMTGQ